MVAHAQVFQLKFVAAKKRHFLYRVDPVAPVTMIMKRAFQIVKVDQLGQGVGFGFLNKRCAFTQFGGYPGQIGLLIYKLLALRLFKVIIHTAQNRFYVVVIARTQKYLSIIIRLCNT